jgi:hypothetical protein
MAQRTPSRPILRLSCLSESWRIAFFSRGIASTQWPASARLALFPAEPDASVAEASVPFAA